MSRARNKLTAMQIKKAGPGTYQDGGGLSLKKTETSGKWIYRYSISGRRRDMGLGTLADVSLSEARQQRDICDGGRGTADVLRRKSGGR